MGADKPVSEPRTIGLESSEKQVANSNWKWGARNTIVEDQLHLEAVKRCIKAIVLL